MEKLTTVRFMIPSILLVVLIHSRGVSAQDGNSANGVIGKSITFHESLPNQGDVIITWSFKGTIRVARFPANGNPEYGDQYKGRCTLSRNGTLTLDNLQYTDAGEYTMTALNATTIDIILTSTYQLKVHPPLIAPVLSSNSTYNNQFANGSYVSLSCDGNNQYITDYTFSRDGKNICSEPHVNCTSSHLYFQPITSSDSGNYTCVIRNPFSSNTSNTLQLTEAVPVSGVNLTTTVSGELWPGINSTSMTCSARGTDVSYTWSLKGAPLPQDPRYQLSQPGNSSLTVNPISSNDDGPFACTASNWLGKASSNGLNFTFASNVSNVLLISNASTKLVWADEDSVSLHCTADGTAVHFRWKLDGQLLNTSFKYQITEGGSPPSSNLTIRPISRTDAGNFTCEAFNLISNMTSNVVTFHLGLRPDKNISCSANGTDTSVELQCSWPGGQPAANVSLMSSKETRTGDTTVTLTVNSTNNNVQGSNLTCHGDQFGRTSECTMPFEAPQAIGHNNNSVTQGTAGSQIVLTIELKEGLPSVFAWKTPAGFILQSRATAENYKISSTIFKSSLHILDATEGNNGTYECTAKNIIGSQTFRFAVSVTGKAETPTKPPSPSGGLDGGAIAGIVIGVLAGIALIGILAFFLVRKNQRSKERERINEPGDQLATPVYATVNKQNGGIAETSVTENQQDSQDDVKYAVIKFPQNNSSAKAPNPTPEETEYSTVKTSANR